MLCPNCQSEFNSTTNLPRILIFCGHTFCHQCIEQLIETAESEQNTGPKSFQCPDCSTVNQAADGVNSFPKNLVLLQVNTQQQPVQQQPAQSQPPKEQKTDQQSARLSTIKSVCTIHNKKLEAFCEKDLQVLCIDCILSEQHKSHEIVSVQKACERQKQYLYDEVSNATKTEERLRFIYSDIKRHISDMHNQAEKNRRELSQIYNYVREVILEREQALKRQISDNLQREEQESQDKLSDLQEFMNKIGGLKSELVDQSQESEIELLQKARIRSQQCSDINGQRSRELAAISIMSVASTSQSLNEIKREQELSQLSKLINPTYKGNQVPQQSNNANQAAMNPMQGNSTLYSHTMASKMKRAGTMNPSQQVQNPTLPGANPVLQKELSNNPQSMPLEKRMQEDLRKSNKNTHIKSKVSPHRGQTTKKVIDQQAQICKTSKQGVVVLDSNKQKPTTNQSSKSKQPSNGHFNQIIQQHINLYNYNQQDQQLHDDCSEDIIVSGMHADDVSSIYPLETNECYFQYSPRSNLLKTNNINNPEQRQEIKRDESVGALNDLLESLNKSHDINTQQNSGSQQQLLLRESSTASEITGSNSDLVQNSDKGVKQVKSNIETPRSKKINPWMAGQRQKSGKSNKKGLTKDNSKSEFEEFKSASKMHTPRKNTFQNQYYMFEENKNSIHRSGSLQRYNTNSLMNTSTNQQNNNDYEDRIIPIQESRKVQKNTQKANLMSLSQERNKRKARKADLQSEEQSPVKVDYTSPEKHNQQHSQELMVMLQECTKNIEKLEFRPSAKKKQKALEVNIQQDSPCKQSVNTTNAKTAICLVDLTSKDESSTEHINIRVSNDDAALILAPEDEDSQYKNLPNASKQKDHSPFKPMSHTYDNHSQHSSPFKEQQPNESFEKMINQFQLNAEQLATKNQLQQQLQVSTSHVANDVSVDTSVSDPFRALCRVKEEFIFVFSGFNDQKLMMCEALDVQRGVWKEICQIGKARTKFSAVPISKSRILLFGGKLADGQRTGEIEEYNLKTNKFKTLPFKLPKPRSGFAACVKREEGKIFFCGGNSGAVLKKFDCLDLKKGKWSRWPEMIQKRDELAVALGPDGKIYAIGGYGGGSPSSNTEAGDINQEGNIKQSSSNCLRTAERFDFNTGQWEMLPEMNEARRALAAVALPDGIYAIGGYDGKQYLSSVEKFDLQKQQWITVKSMNTSRCTLSAVASADCQYIYALGGFNGNSLDLVERYNIMTDEWEFMTPMNSKRFMHEAVCLITH